MARSSPTPAGNDGAQEGAAFDADLVERVAAGDKAALAALYDRYAPLLLGVALRMLGARGEAEDLLHDVFLEVWKRAGDFDRARGSVRAWLVTRVRSRALDRKKSPRVARAVAWDEARAEREASPLEGPAQQVARGLERRRVKEALHALPDEQRAALEMAYFEGLPLADVAARQGCPIGTVKSRLAAARDKLRSLLERTGGAP